MIENELYYQYAKDVVDGNIVAGELIKLSCQRFLDDLNDDRFEFRADKVKKCVNFMQALKHYTGKHAGTNFILLPFQVWITANLVGFYWKGTNQRRFTQSYIQMARKQGKSFFAGALCLYFLIADGEASAEVLLLANSRQQAKDIDFAVVAALAKQLDPKQKILKQFRDYLTIPVTQSRLKVLAAEAKTGDGYNCSFGLIDEFHESPDTKMKDLVVSSQGMRESPHCCIITTAGFDKTKPCYRLRCYSAEVLHKTKTDDSLFAAVYELDENDDWTDEKNWIKSNPCLGQTVSVKYIQEQVTKAMNNPSDEVGVKTKTLNVWCSSSEVWIPETTIMKSSNDLNIEDFAGESCYIGIDLAAVSDLTVVSVLIPKDGKYHFINKYYLPQSALEDKPQKDKYRLWKDMGLLTITAGNVTDYDYITNDLMRIREILNIQGIYYDSWNSTQWAIDATQKGLPLFPYSQSLGNFNKPTKEFERLILSDRVILDNNEITRFCFGNVILKYDHNNNCKPVKYADANKIDGVIGIIEALGGYLTTPAYNNDIFIINDEIKEDKIWI